MESPVAVWEYFNARFTEGETELQGGALAGALNPCSTLHVITSRMERDGSI